MVAPPGVYRESVPVPLTEQNREVTNGRVQLFSGVGDDAGDVLFHEDHTTI
jgi:hypothetical protein